MKSRFLLTVLLGFASLVSLLILGVSPAKADGIIIPTPCHTEDCPPERRLMNQLVIRYHHVDVEIDDQLAITHVDQVFYNPNTWPVEGTYLFPLPLDATVSNFTLWVDGKPIEGKVLDAMQARQKYEEIVSNLRDPALLEYIGRGAVQASIFPIPPKGERRIELKYTQALTAENGLVRYIYPLNTEKFSTQPLESVAVTVKVKTSQTVRAVYSPSHPVDISRQDDHHFVASYEESNVLPNTDFALYYSLGESEAFHLFSYRDPGDLKDPDGFFLLLLAPKPGEETQAISKDVLLVLDRSGSMDGEKIIQAQNALRYILKHLNPGDRFYLSTFSSMVETYSSDLRPASEAPEALAWVDRIGAAGSTDINLALLDAAAAVDQNRPTYLIFLTDGLPTRGVMDSQKILDNFTKAAPASLRVFTFGVGYDVDTFLLDSLSQEHHGLSTYVKPDEPLDEVISGFYSRISTPVLTDLALNFGTMTTYDIYPSPLPDLFSGSQVVVVGRYRAGGKTDIQLSGVVNGKQQVFRFSDQTFTQDSREVSGPLTSLPRLWATRKIGYLLNKIRLQGADQEMIDQIVRLSIRYGIVTPYTSYLVTEPMPLGEENQHRIAEDTFNQMQGEPPAPSSGAGAVEKAKEQGGLSQAEVPPQAPQMAEQTIRSVGSHTFVLNQGTWVDTTYDPDSMVTQKIAFLSPDYFTLVQNRPDIAWALALGERVIVVVDGTALEIVASDEKTQPLVLPTFAIPTEEASSPIPKVAATPITALPAAEFPEEKQPATSPSCLGGLLPIGAVFMAVIRSRGKATYQSK